MYYLVGKLEQSRTFYMYFRFTLFEYKGGESRDLVCLFCTCIRTERARKLFSTSLILNEFSCSKVQMPCLRK